MPREADHVGQEHTHTRPSAVNKTRQELGAEKEQPQTPQKRHHEGHDLIAAQTGDEQPQRQEKRAQQNSAQVRRGNRAEIGIAERRQHPRDRQGAGQRDDKEHQARKEFPQHELVRLHREGQQHFPSVLLSLLGPDAHGHRRQENAHDERQGIEEAAHVGNQQRKERRHEQPDAEQQEDDHEDVADGRTVIRSQFPTKNSAEIAHGLLILVVPKRRSWGPSGPEKSLPGCRPAAPGFPPASLWRVPARSPAAITARRVPHPP